ncbi:MAG: hypothetical protein NTW19_02335, partial [Planctomycetota bacterium]|nr:hypothetical protein [Planctomycetota bacterium]
MGYMKKFGLLAASCVLIAGGCARPLDVHVIDAATRVPIAGAKVDRMDLRRPYFIVGEVVAKESRVADASGVVRLAGRGGILVVGADGYESKKAAIDQHSSAMTIGLKRAAATQPGK